MRSRSSPSPQADSPEDPRETKDRILDAAEELFRERGVAGTSLRAITAAAGANVAAVHYHYGGRDELLRAVLERRVGAVNEQRLSRLAALEEGDAALSLESVLEAFLAPALFGVADDPALSQVSELLLTEPAVRSRGLAVEIFGDVFDRFASRLEQLLPELPAHVVRKRFSFAVGAMVHTLHGPLHDFPGLESAAPPRDRAQESLSSLTTFLSAGLRAPHGESR